MSNIVLLTSGEKQNLNFKPTSINLSITSKAKDIYFLKLIFYFTQDQTFSESLARNQKIVINNIFYFSHFPCFI